MYEKSISKVKHKHCILELRLQWYIILQYGNSSPSLRGCVITVEMKQRKDNFSVTFIFMTSIFFYQNYTKGKGRYIHDIYSKVCHNKISTQYGYFITTDDVITEICTVKANYSTPKRSKENWNSEQMGNQIGKTDKHFTTIIPTV